MQKKIKILAARLCLSLNMESVKRTYILFLNSDISVEVTGLGILDWLASNISSWVIGLLNDEVIAAVSSQLREYVTEILPNVDANRVFA
jgi:hypothetical protein